MDGATRAPRAPRATRAAGATRRRARRRLTGLALATLALLPGAVLADGRALARLALPDGASLALVAEDVVQHGRPVAIATFEARAPLDSVRDFYRELWPADESGPGHVEVELGPWRIVSRLEGGTNLALQLRDDGEGGSAGLVSAMRLDAAGSAPEPPPLPPGAELLSTTESREGRRRVTTHVVSAIGRPGETAGFYRDAMARAGWRNVSERTAGDAIVTALARRGRRAEIVVVAAADGTSTAILNEITGGL